MIVIKRIEVCLTLSLIVLLLTACVNSIPQSMEIPGYNGRNLTIGVIGQVSEIREDNKVTFVEMQFSDLKEEYISQLDAIIITEENLSEAAQAQYTAIYRESEIPYFFIESDKSDVPFTQEDISYEEVPDLSELDYATGIVYEDGTYTCFGYGLDNDMENRENIKNVYTQIFETISKEKKIQ